MAENMRKRANEAYFAALLPARESWAIVDRLSSDVDAPAAPAINMARSHDARLSGLPTYDWAFLAPAPVAHSDTAPPAQADHELLRLTVPPPIFAQWQQKERMAVSSSPVSETNPDPVVSVSNATSASPDTPIPATAAPASAGAPSAAGDVPLPTGPGPTATDAGPASAPAEAASPLPSVSFPGNSVSTNLRPKPDSCLAAGLNHIVTTESARIQWYDKTGKLLSDQSLNRFFNVPDSAILADARVVYDSVRNRFVVESDQAFENKSSILLAVSKDSDPSHGWHFSSINTTLTINGQQTWADFPGLATDGDAVYLTGVMRSFEPFGFPDYRNPFVESHLWIIDAGVGTGGFYDGGPLKVSDFDAKTVTGGITPYFGQPSQLLSPASGAVGTYLVNTLNTGGPIQVVTVGKSTTSPTFNFQSVPGIPSALIRGFDSTASQPGTSVTISGVVTGNAVWLNNSLYVASTGIPISGPDTGIATVQWEKIDTSNLGSLRIVDQGEISGSLLGAGQGVATYVPSILANANGDFLVDFVASGPNLFAGAYYALHAASDAPGTIRTPMPLHVGEDIFALPDPNGVVRFGHYHGGLDPVDGSTFWIFNEYAALRGPAQIGNWATQIAAVPSAGAVTSGGRWVFSSSAGFSGLILGINNGVAPVFPTPVAGAFNVEVFTNPALAGQPGIPNPNPGFQSSIANPGGTLENGYLTGTDLRLTTGDLLLVDSVTGAGSQGPSKVTLGSGNQTVVGARFDTLVGGSGSQILSALVGNETVVGGTGNASIWGGAGDSIVAGSGANQQIVVTGSLTTVVAGIGGNATISAAAQNTILSLGGSTQNAVIAAGVNSLVDLTGNSGLVAVIGAVGDTIVAGKGTTNIEGVSGGMQIVVGAGGITNVSGSAVPGLSNTIVGGAGNLSFNPSAQAGQGDLFNLSGSTGIATINAFSFGATRITSHDTIVAGNGADSVFAGDGDRVGTGNGPTVGGVHLWDHSDRLAGSAVGFGSNDTVASTAYDTVAHTATRHPEIVGSSTAVVTVTSFDTTTDYLFYQNENSATTNAIIATSQATTVAGIASSVVTLPDGTVMTLVGITPVQLAPSMFRP
jgi:hypothetical protein